MFVDDKGDVYGAGSSAYGQLGTGQLNSGSSLSLLFFDKRNQN